MWSDQWIFLFVTVTSLSYFCNSYPGTSLESREQELSFDTKLDGIYIYHSLQLINILSASKSNLIWAAHKNLRSACYSQKSSFIMSFAEQSGFKSESIHLLHKFNCYKPQQSSFVKSVRLVNVGCLDWGFSSILHSLSLPWCKQL